MTGRSAVAPAAIARANAKATPAACTGRTASAAANTEAAGIEGVTVLDIQLTTGHPRADNVVRYVRPATRPAA